MTEPINVRPIAPPTFKARCHYLLWGSCIGIYNIFVTGYIILLFLWNQPLKIGKDPRRKQFRSLDPSKPLKVGIVSEYYYPHLGGLSGDVHYAAVEFAQMGYDVKLITSHVKEPHNLRFSEHGFEILRVGRSIPVFSNESLAKVTFGFRLGRQVKRLLQEQQFDVIHIHCPLTPVLPILVQRYATCPLIGHIHTLVKSKPFFYRIFQRHLTRLMNDFEGHVAVSKISARQWEDWFHCSFKVIPNGVPIEEFKALHPRIKHFDDGKINLFFIGRMEPRNGIAVLIDAFRIIHKELPNTRLILAGAGPLKSFFEETIEKELRPHVHFVGPILEEKPQYFATADINICPTTRLASLGVTLLESMASGKPTVASNIPAFNETVSAGKDVLLAHPDRPEEFAAQVIRLICEPGLGSLLGKRAQIKMERTYSWKMIIQKVDDYTQTVLSEVHSEKREKTKMWV